MQLISYRRQSLPSSKDITSESLTPTAVENQNLAPAAVAARLPESIHSTQFDYSTEQYITFDSITSQHMVCSILLDYIDYITLQHITDFIQLHDCT